MCLKYTNYICTNFFLPRFKTRPNIYTIYIHINACCHELPHVNVHFNRKMASNSPVYTVSV